MAKCCYIYIVICYTYLALTKSEFRRVSPATEKDLVLTFVLTFGNKNSITRCSKPSGLSCRSEQ